MKSIREYHEATKHSWEKLYQDRHILDWSNQPNPFRTYQDCPRINLGNRFEKMDTPLSKIWFLDDVKPRNEPITLSTLSTLLTQVQQVKIVSLAISGGYNFRPSFFGTTSLSFHG